MLGHEQHCRVELVGALAQQLAYGVAVDTAARNLNLVWDLQQHPAAQQAKPSVTHASKQVAGLVL